MLILKESNVDEIVEKYKKIEKHTCKFFILYLAKKLDFPTY